MLPRACTPSRLARTRFASYQPLRVALLSASQRRHFADSTSEGPQSAKKTQDAKDKVQKDPRLREIDEIIADKFAKIRDDDYGESLCYCTCHILPDGAGQINPRTPSYSPMA
jgi:hypothetical protein